MKNYCKFCGLEIVKATSDEEDRLYGETWYHKFSRDVGCPDKKHPAKPLNKSDKFETLYNKLSYNH